MPESTPWYGPDERIYAAQGQNLRKLGLCGLRRMAAEYLSVPEVRQYPSPLRVVWIALSALVGSERGLKRLSMASWFGLMALVANVWGLWAGLLVATSPLCFIVGRRALQDVAVALIGVSLVAGMWGNMLPLGVFLLLGTKEAAVLWLPAVLLGTGQPALIVAGVLFWLLVLVGVYGLDALRLLRAAASSHGHEYGSVHQVGGPFRYLVDLVFLSAPVLGVIVWFHGRHSAAHLGLAVLLGHCSVRTKNARFVLGADVLLRAAVGALLGPWALGIALWDLYVMRRVRYIYDPVTARLTESIVLGEPKR